MGCEDISSQSPNNEPDASFDQIPEISSICDDAEHSPPRDHSVCDNRNVFCVVENNFNYNLESYCENYQDVNRDHLEEYEQSIDDLMDEGRFDLAALNYAILSSRYYSICDYEKFDELYHNARNVTYLARENDLLTIELANAYFVLSDIAFLNYGDYNEAEQLSWLALDLAEELGDDGLVFDSSIRIAMLYHCQNHEQRMIEYCEEIAIDIANSFANSSDVEDQTEALFLFTGLANWFSEKGDNESAGKYFEIAGDIRNHLTNPSDYISLIPSSYHYLLASVEYCCAGLDCDNERIIEKISAVGGYPSEQHSQYMIEALEEMGCGL